MRENVFQTIKSASHNAGVYIFYKDRKPLYIGKAADLKTRLNSYLKTNDHKTIILNKEANLLKIEKCLSPIGALIEEARLIKKLNPELNVYWKDNKQYFYVVFTNDRFPKIFITHRPQLSEKAIGPFTDGRSLKLILKILRKHFPYCSCLKNHRRHCLNSQIGLCFGICCSINKENDTSGAAKDYRKNIILIKDILRGKKNKLLNKIIKPADNWAARNIIEHKEYLDERPIKKIECYDISNFAGKEAVGAMTVLVGSDNNWRPDPNQFRKFKIKSEETKNDPAMIAEILSRRLAHREWSYPDLIVIDGGINQYKKAKLALDNFKIPSLEAPNLISFAKPHKQIIGQYNQLFADKKIIERIIQQTHNFVIGYHRQTRRRAMIK